MNEQRLIELHLAEALDPVRLAARAGIDLDPWQRELVREQPSRALVLASRQAGKSTVTAVLALHTALYRPGSLTILVAPSQRQSAELLNRVRSLMSALDVAPDTETEAVLHISFPNGSRILAVPGSESTLRGYTAHLVICDEASRIPTATIEAIRPMLAVSGGALICISTPNGHGDWFAKAWHSDEASGWRRWRIPATEVPRITPEFLAQEQASLPDAVYRAEYMVEFVDSSAAVFSAEAIADLLSGEGDDAAPRAWNIVDLAAERQRRRTA